MGVPLSSYYLLVGEAGFYYAGREDGAITGKQCLEKTSASWVTPFFSLPIDGS